MCIDRKGAELEMKKILRTALTVTAAGVGTLTGLGALIGWKMEHPTIEKPKDGLKHIACVGDSITFGAGVARTRKTESYPAYLQALAGEEYQVLNYGFSGRTLLSDGDNPYTRERMHAASVMCKADKYILMLGTNDSKPYNWNKENFEREAAPFIEKYISMAGAENVYVMLPPKAFVVEGKEEVGYDILNEHIIEELDILARAAAKLNAPVIDLYTFTEEHPEWFPDGVHPNAEGNKAIAEHVYQCVFETV